MEKLQCTMLHELNTRIGGYGFTVFVNKN